jgi:hypothetical protein
MHLTGKDKHRFKMKGYKKILQANVVPKLAGIVIINI